MVERLQSFEIYVKPLQSYIDEREISHVAFDNDGTLIDSKPTYINGMTDACGIIYWKELWNKYRNNKDSYEYKKANEIALKEMGPIIDSLRNEFKVERSVTIIPTITIAKLYGLDVNNKYTQKAIQRIEKIYYKDGAEPFPRSVETVMTFNKTTADSVLATHADPVYVEPKNKPFTGLFEKRIFFDTWRLKSVQWEEKLTAEKIDPNHLLGIGDNFEADIVPLIDLNAWAVWINRGSKISFSPENTHKEKIQKTLESDKLIIVSDISEVVPKLASLV